MSKEDLHEWEEGQWTVFAGFWASDMVRVGPTGDKAIQKRSRSATAVIQLLAGGRSAEKAEEATDEANTSEERGACNTAGCVVGRACNVVYLLFVRG
jgi:hypothetical protein